MQVHGRKGTYTSTQSFVTTNLPCYKKWAVGEVGGERKEKKGTSSVTVTTPRTETAAPTYTSRFMAHTSVKTGVRKYGSCLPNGLMEREKQAKPKGKKT